MTESLWTDILAVPFSQRYYDVNGVRTRVLEAGTPGAPALLLLHGVNGHAETYVQNIGAHANDFRVYAVDFIGHGWSSKPLDRTYEIATYVRHILDFMDVVNVTKAWLSGESLGGWVSARLAAEHPERVERLVMNTPGGLNANSRAIESLRTLTREAVTEPTREKVRKRLEWLFKDPATILDDLVETRFRIYSQPEYREVTERTLCLQDMEIRKRNMLSAEELARIQAPTLLVWTTADPIAVVDVGHWCRDQIEGSQFVLMENSGHWPQFEEPDLFNRVHIEFLSGRRVRGRAQP